MQEPAVVHIDIETYCELDIRKVGAYAYAAHPSFEILLIVYEVEGQPRITVEPVMPGEPLPTDLFGLLLDKNVTKVAHHAAFERVCLSRFMRDNQYLNEDYLNPQNWYCTSVRASTLGLPRSLAKVGDELNITVDNRKAGYGLPLINYFSKPVKPTRANGWRTRNLPHHDMEKWELFRKYCSQDVTAEMAIYRAEQDYIPTTDRELYAYELDQLINDKGVAIDMVLVDAILDHANEHTGKLLKRASEITGLDNPNSIVQIKNWLVSKGYDIKTLNKNDVSSLLEQDDLDDDIREVLEIRAEVGKTSVAKFEAMKRSAVFHERTQTWRIHGMLMFYGAMRTGRWAGRIVQLQNLPSTKYDEKEIEYIRSLVLEGKFDWLNLEYPNLMDLFSQLIRTALIPDPNQHFIVADYSAIEARVIAWLADEQWKLDIFRGDGKIYEATASKMFGIPVEDIQHGSDYRSKGKVAELAGGYGGGVNAYKAFGTSDWSDNEISHMVQRWRASNPNIVKAWWDAEKAMGEAIEHPGETRTRGALKDKGVSFKMQRDTLFLNLPSGRALAYRGARINDGKIEYLGENMITGKYEFIRTYGGRIIENIVQAIARDILLEAMIRIYQETKELPSFHVHDEAVYSTNEKSTFAFTEKMKINETQKWAKEIPLNADGYTCKYYIKL